MGTKLRTLIIAVAVGALACTVMAQPTGGGGGGGGRGGQRGGGMMMRNNPFSMLTVKEIQDELKLTPDAITKITALQTEYQDARRKASQDVRDSGGTREEQQAAGQKVSDEYTKKLNDILTADQVKRLKELRIQRAGNMALTMPDVQKELSFTSDQTAKVKDLQDKMMTAMRDLFQNQTMSQDDKTAAMKKNNETMNAELLKVLTEDQATKFKTMGGKPFTFPKSMDMGGPGGRRGGGPGGGGPGGGGPGGGGGGGG